MNPYLYSAAIILCIMIIMYVISRFTKDNSTIDVIWGLGFCVVSLAVTFKYPPISPQKVFLLAMVLLWGTRLGGYILYRKLDKPEDFRYAQWRKDWGKTEVWRSFLQIYMLQGALMFLMCLPLIKILSEAELSQLGIVHDIGIAVFLVGWIIEALADYQKNSFKNKHPQKLMKSGLWSYSRHPNYLGEVILWWGIAVFCIASGAPWLGLVSALIITVLIRFVSGVPMLEKAKEGNSAYDDYKKETPIFLPIKL